MNYKSPYKAFHFEGYTFDPNTFIAEFRYSFDQKLKFTERLQFEQPTGLTYQADLFDRCLGLIFMLAGTSYYKCFPTRKAIFDNGWISRFDAEMLNTVYRDGMSQFIYENGLDPNGLVRFESNVEPAPPIPFSGRGVLSMQSGGKDSLLLASLLEEMKISSTPWYMTSSGTYPKVIEKANRRPPRMVRRQIDRPMLELAQSNEGLNGHVPITFIALAIALADAVLHGENVVLASIGHEGDEAHETIGEFAINHQWSKTWQAEQLLTGYILAAMSPDLHVGSPIRALSEMRITELFAERCWTRLGRDFSSCNVANYKQTLANESLKWCGRCAKCANSYLLFSPFVEPEELRAVFGGQDLFAVPDLHQTFKGLLGIDGIMKPFECVGEVAELRLAYHMAQRRFSGQIQPLPFDVPDSNFDYKQFGNQQVWTRVFMPEWMLERPN